MKTIYILLTRSTSVLSSLIHLFSGDAYTHSSISFSASLQPMFSSGRKNGDTLIPAGPCREVFHRGFYLRNRHIPCALYALQVSDEVYDRALAEAEAILAQADRYHFNLLGVALARIGISLYRKNYYFCSQFVGEILLRSGALEALPVQTTVIRPMHLAGLEQLECVYTGRLSELLALRGTLNQP